MTEFCQTIGEAVVLGAIAIGCPYLVFKTIEVIDRIWRNRG